MRRKSIFVLLSSVIIVAVTWIGVYAQKVAQDQPGYDAIAHKIVNYALEVKPGEVVIITGTPAELDLLSALVVAVRKAGGNRRSKLIFLTRIRELSWKRPLNT